LPVDRGGYLYRVYLKDGFIEKSLLFNMLKPASMLFLL